MDNKEREHVEFLMAQQAKDSESIRPFNTRVIYHFPYNELDPVTVYTTHIPNVGELVTFSSLERNPQSANKTYGNREKYWRVKNRIFVLTVPTSNLSILTINTQQHVEIQVESLEQDT